MLKTLRIQNFKGWKDTGEIKLSPITLFFGANSSGKSSIGQFLMMLKQTAESSDRKSVFFLGSNNSHVQLGSYQDVIFQHDLDNDINFSYSWELPSKLEIRDILKKSESLDGNIIHFSATVNADKKANIPSLKRFEYRIVSSLAKEINVSLEKSEKGGYSLGFKNFSFVRATGRPWKLPHSIHFYGFPDEINAYYQNANFLPQFNLEQENLFRRIFYLGPLRSKPGRIYSWPGDEPDGVGDAGENTVSAILAAKGRRINLGNKKPRKPFEEVIAEALKKLGLIDSFKVKNISEGGQRREYEVTIQTKGSKDEVLLPDVGFGVSQVLPVLVACFYASPNSIIVMEQPEIHLHPAAQAALADVMIDVINSRENYQERNIQLIIETHSEHFLRRLQRRIAEDASDELNDKISAYFVNTTEHPVSLENLNIDLFGNIQNWPKDFFGDEMGDISSQMAAAIKKRKLQIKTSQKGDE